jgi:hypothetical protein
MRITFCCLMRMGDEILAWFGKVKL